MSLQSGNSTKNTPRSVKLRSNNSRYLSNELREVGGPTRRLTAKATGMIKTSNAINKIINKKEQLRKKMETMTQPGPGITKSEAVQNYATDFGNLIFNLTSKILITSQI